MGRSNKRRGSGFVPPFLPRSNTMNNFTEDLTGLSRADLVYKAKLAEQAERYDEMMEYMSKVAESGSGGADAELSVEERNLLSVAYKNVIGARRASWRIISSIETKEESKYTKESDVVRLIQKYKGNVEKELSDICDRILKLLRDHLEETSSSGESKVFYKKMKGDYYRYLAEFKGGEARRNAAEETLLAYKEAENIASNELAPTHPIRLGLALNFSVFYYEIPTPPSERATWPRRLSTRPSRSWTPSARSPTRIPPSSCSSSAITSRCGPATWLTRSPGVARRTPTRK